MFSGVLRKMPTELTQQVQYYLPLPNHFLHLNQSLNKKVCLRFKGYECLNCSSNETIFRQGFCKKC